MVKGANEVDKRKVIYYSDELNDEFSTAVITPRRIDGDYVYCHDSLFKRFTHIFWYRNVFTPIAYLHSKLCECLASIFHNT